MPLPRRMETPLSSRDCCSILITILIQARYVVSILTSTLRRTSHCSHFKKFFIKSVSYAFMGVYSATKFHFFPGTRRCFPKNFGLKGTVFTKNSQKNRDKPHNFKKFSQNVEKFSKFRAILAKISRKFVKITSLLVQMLNCCPKSEKLSPC